MFVLFGCDILSLGFLLSLPDWAKHMYFHVCDHARNDSKTLASMSLIMSTLWERRGEEMVILIYMYMCAKTSIAT